MRRLLLLKLIRRSKFEYFGFQKTMTAYWKCLQFTRLIRIHNTIYKSTAHIKIPKHPLKPVTAFFFWNDLSIWHHYTKLFTSHSNREALRNSLWPDEETRIVPVNPYDILDVHLHKQ